MRLFRFGRVFQKKRCRRRSSHNQYRALEARRLLAGISFDAGSGEVLIVGTNDDDSVVVTQQNTDLTINLANIDQQTFLAESVTAVRFRGLNGNDSFVNNSNIDSFAYGHDGNDSFVGGSGNDRFQGGSGDDFLNGMAANDLLQGNDGNDTILGGDQHDRVRGGNGNDLIKGEQGNDHLSGNEGNDRIEGMNGKDRIFGQGGNDILIGGNASDRIEGGTGADTIEGQHGYDRLFGQEGNDTIRGGVGNDKIYGDAGDDSIFGNEGNDLIVGGDGQDSVRGDSGDDQINLGPADDLASFTATMSNYSSVENGAAFVITDHRSGMNDGRDTITGAEQFRFADGDRFPNQLPANLNEAEQESFRLLNQLRVSLGKSQLSAASDVSQYARDWSREMSQTGFRHSPSESRLSFLINGRTYIAENIVFYDDPNESAANIAVLFHDAWRNSPNHYQHMINDDFTEAGIGLFRGSNGWFGTHIFTNG